MIWVVNVPILLDSQLIVILKHYYCAFVTICAAVVRCTEDSHNWWECRLTSPLVHLVTIELNLMCPDDREQVVLFEEVLDWAKAKLEGTLSFIIVLEIYLRGLTILYWIRPDQVTEKPI